MDGGDFNVNKVTHGNIFKALEEWAPKNFAYDWDNVGLQVGSHADETKKILVTLDVLESVVDEAVANEVNLIIAHHPLIFSPLKNINFQSVKGKIIKKIIKHDITVYAAHTNLDIANGGVNDLLCEALNLVSTKPLVDKQTEKILKLVVFVPITHAEIVREALGNAGAGYIGNYSHCTFQSAGEGTFKPLEGTNPYIGSTNELEKVEELKIETVVKESDLDHVITAMKNVHPYEEVAYDLYPLELVGDSYGLGRIGSFEEPMSLQSLCDKVKKAYQVDDLRVTGDLDKQIKNVAIIGGSGEKYIYQAKTMGADVFITGDVTFHHAQDAKELGLAVIDPGHYIEQIMKKATKNYLTNHFSDIQVYESKINTDPFQFV